MRNAPARSNGTAHEQLERKILVELDSGGSVTQRSLSSQLGIALGLTNLLMHRLVRKGWVRMKQVSPRRIRYLITPAGMLAKARLTREYLLSSLAFYRECRERLRERLSEASAELAARGADSDGCHDIVFYGAGEVAEVAYVCLHETELTLLGLVDAAGSKPFLHLPVHPPSELSGRTLAGRQFSMLIVMPSQDEHQVQAILADRSVPSDLVFWL